MEEEIWKAIPGYEGSYEVSNLGKVRSLDRYVGHNYGEKQRRIGCILSPRKGPYLNVCLLKKQLRRNDVIHNLVMEAFIGKKPNGYHVNHKDSNKWNNRLDNLEYVTPSDNMLHAFKNGIIKPLRGEENGHSKLKATQIIEIRMLYGENIGGRYGRGNMTFRELAKRFNVSFGHIRDIVYRRKWKHLELEVPHL